jgi:hypothetical protein
MSNADCAIAFMVHLRITRGVSGEDAALTRTPDL